MEDRLETRVTESGESILVHRQEIKVNWIIMAVEMERTGYIQHFSHYFNSGW